MSESDRFQSLPPNLMHAILRFYVNWIAGDERGFRPGRVCAAGGTIVRIITLAHANHVMPYIAKLARVDLAWVSIAQVRSR